MKRLNEVEMVERGRKAVVRGEGEVVRFIYAMRERVLVAMEHASSRGRRP